MLWGWACDVGSAVWVRLSQRQVGAADGVRNERLTLWHHICYGAGPPGRRMGGLGRGGGALL